MVAKTQERMELLRELWVQPVRTDEIIDRLNALDGDHVRKDRVHKWASDAKIKRCPIMIIQTLSERASEMRASFAAGYERSLSPTPERDPQFGGLIFTPEWPRETIIQLIEAWNKGLSTLELQRMFERPKNSIIGKIHRLRERGLVQARQSPIIRDLDDMRRNVSLTRQNVPRPKVTLVPIRREVAVVVAPASKATEAKRVAEPSIFDNFAYRPPTVAPVQAFAPPSRTCQWPTNEGNIGRGIPWLFCGDVAEPGYSYCTQHCRSSYVGWRGARNAA